MDNLVVTPAECVALINQTLEIAYPTVMVQGEVASFKVSRDKYIFFDIKDDEATIGCFMMAWQLRTPLEDGMKIKVLAEPRLTRWGKFSLTVRQVMPVGQGNIKRAFELLKAKFEAEGLLDEARKRPLPQIPRRVGVISSVESAGYADFLKILNARWGGVELQVANVQVQGLSAIEQNIAAIAYFHQQAEPVDVLVIIRGGGSADDLAVYNDEGLARAIAASRIPTLVGVGHEVDTSLADLVADVRAATPSNAAQILVPDRREWTQQLAIKRQHLARTMHNTLMHRHQLVRHATAKISEIVDMGEQRLQLTHFKQLLHTRQRHMLEQTTQYISGHTRALRQLDPRLVLKRGYGIVRAENARCISSISLLSIGQIIQIEVSDGTITAEIRSAYGA